MFQHQEIQIRKDFHVSASRKKIEKISMFQHQEIQIRKDFHVSASRNSNLKRFPCFSIKKFKFEKISMFRHQEIQIRKDFHVSASRKKRGKGIFWVFMWEKMIKSLKSFGN
jgi:hypothetical protein